jgi:hypothetical protein
MTAQSGLGFSGIVAIQIPDDGAPGTVLTKLTADNYDYDWLGGGGGASTIIVEDEGVPVGVPADTLDFVGAGVTASGAGTTKTITIPGGGSVDNMQDTYDNTGVTQPKIEVIAANGAITFRDALVSIGDLLILEDNAGVDFFNVAETQLQFGATPQRLLDINNIIAGYGGIEFYPDDFTRTLVGGPAIAWNSSLTSSVPGGGGVGNETAPNFVNWAGEVILTEQGNLFNTQSLFNQSTTITLEGANTGPIYTMINQPNFRTGVAGGARIGSQQNAVRSQIRIGPNLAGTFALTSHETYFATCIMSAAGGAVSIGTVNYFAPKAPGGMGGGATIGTLNCMDIPNIPSTGITTLRGINSAMNSGQFINHTGTASAEFTNSAFRMRFDDNAGIEMGTGNDVLVRWDGATFNFEFATGGDFEFTGPSAGQLVIGSPTADDGLQLDFSHLSIGTTATTGTPNWFTIFSAPNLRSPGVGGEYSDVLWTAGGTIDINGLAISDLQAFKINSPSVILSGGTIANMSNLFVSAMPSFGAPLRQALRVTGRATIDGVINNGSNVQAQITANQNDYQLGQNNNQRTMNLLDSDAAYNITGIDSADSFAQTGDRLCLYNTGAFNLTLTNQDVLSLAANRIITSTGVSYIIGPNECVWLWYDDTGTARWRMLEGTGA